MDANQVVDLICEPDATASKCKVVFENGNMLVSILIKGAKKIYVDECNENAATRYSVNIDRRLRRSPREILTEIFKIHGTDLDPEVSKPAFEAIAEAVRSNLSPTMDPTSASTEEPADSAAPLQDPELSKPAFEAIAEAVRSNLSPTMDPTSASTEEPADSAAPLKKYDCFISYRHASESNIAEKLYYYLRLAGFNPFLDKHCLELCEDWKNGFISALQCSKCFISLISTVALKPATDSTRNHENDNYLLEMYNAQKLQSLPGNDRFIIPVHVGEYVDVPQHGRVLVKFKDFEPTLYSESIVPTCEQSLTVQYKTDPNGDTYHGQVKSDGLKHGYGMLKRANNDVYIGYFQDDQMVGKGFMKYAIGDSYEGEFLANEREGWGTYICAKTGAVYDGEWKEGKKHGKGKCQYADRGDYIGSWENGKRYGKGVCNYSGFRYKGEWKDDKPHGKGKITSPERDTYLGNYEFGKRHGQGQCTYANGDVYTGGWLNGKKHGNGVLVCANKDVYAGRWEEDMYTEENGRWTGYGRSTVVTISAELIKGLFNTYRHRLPVVIGQGKGSNILPPANDISVFSD
jgi:hypothetical protein